jgi:curved DNA-binding protein CbpA
VSSPLTHYQVLGLAQDATPEQVKKRFRELARKYHPDLNRDNPRANDQFLRINEAYEVLNDPNRRAAYDLNLRDEARRAEERSRRPGPVGGSYSPPPPPRETAPGPAGAAQRARQREAERQRQILNRMLEDARIAYARGHLREAQRLCRDVLQIGRVGPAYEMLGDIASRSGEWDDAVRQYTYAAQLVPNNGAIMSKLNRAVARQQGGGGYDIPPGMRRPPVNSSQRMGRQLAITFLGLAVVIFLIVWRPAEDREELGWLLIPHWTLSHLLFMGLAGLAAGAILAAAGWLRPAEQELFYRSVSFGRRGLPLGIILGVVGAIFFPFSVVLYLVIGYFQDVLSPSLFAVFAAVFALTIGFFLRSPTGAEWETFLFSGNVIFPAMMIGWGVGDLFRRSWAQEGGGAEW